ncbi:hypothetical protein [Clostridium butyricum]|uniref:Uncharacterized protein n=1 Tax=Clostridium butyricum TaxID=1492 RepID=A0AAP9RCP1_CLOBU|nr:hypothetical protein [Clostridium butyricum]MBZ5746256.1 hypothetical protein [Clostridium butyricum]MDI9210078.1 hypothetical protein [Clostridium butyricum]QMW90143.1 hypothetical protein FF104_04015 [Clostridium butyricum]BBK77774.1 hypothetical protein Cbu04g_27820 [Clostridium butyricum]GEQ24746.1 hypothetical protein CBU03nite_11690 [Clostridium butyricum]
MSRTIKMKELERTVNDFWRVQGRYYTTVTEVIGYEGVVFSIYDTDTDEVILDLNVPYSECTYELTMKLHEEIINKCYKCQPMNVSFRSFKNVVFLVFVLLKMIF